MSSCRRKSNSLAPNGKVALITTEGGSIALRTKEEGGGNYGHHASKAAANMVGRLLSHDLVDDGIAVVMIHVSAARFILADLELIVTVARIHANRHDEGCGV